MRPFEAELLELKRRRELLFLLQEKRLKVSGSKFASPGVMARALDGSVLQSPALDLLDGALVDAVEGRASRLAFSMPPQEGKSQRVSKWFPFWVLARAPETRVVLASYEHNIARRWGRAVRNLVAQYPQAGLVVRPDTSAADEWQLDGHEGGMFTAGVGGALTGRPADLLIIDDPHKGRAEAESETVRDQVKDWWSSTASARLSPDAPVIILMTRWHEDDLMGWLLREDAGGWRHINIPAIADHDPNKGQVDPLGRVPGEWLESVRRRKPENWERRRKDAGSRDWNALYQGRPSPAEGGFIKRSWLRFFDFPKDVINADGSREVLSGQVIQSWDLAFKDTKGSDFVVGQVWHRQGAAVSLLDQVRARMDFPETCRAIEGMVGKWPQTGAVLVEDKANGPAVLSTLAKTIPGLIPVTPKDSKQARLHAVAPYIEAGNVLLPSGDVAAFSGDLVEELVSFPNGQHDDQVDALSQALAYLMVRRSLASEFMESLLAERRSGGVPDVP